MAKRAAILLLLAATSSAGLLLWTFSYTPPFLAKVPHRSLSSAKSANGRGESAKVASQYRKFRNRLDPASLNIVERNSMFHQLCSVSLGRLLRQDFSAACAVGIDAILPYAIYLDNSPADHACSRRITGSMPITMDQLDLLISFAHTFRIQWHEDSELWDVIWLIAPAKQVATIYGALGQAGVLHDRFRVISQDIILQERSQDPEYKGWHLQQDLKLAMAWASRTNYLLNLDADIMMAKPLAHEDLFTKQGPALTVSSLANNHWSWHHKNLQNTCKSVHIDCKGINKNTTIIGFTPIPFYVPAVFSMAKYLSEREGRPWLEYLISIRTRRKPGVWTEYSLYFVYSRWRGFYHKHHAEVQGDGYKQRLDPRRPEDLKLVYSKPLGDRPPFLDVSDHDIPDTKVWREVITGTDDPYQMTGP